MVRGVLVLTAVGATVAHADPSGDPVADEEVVEIVDKAPVQTAPIAYELTADEARQLPGAGTDALRALQVSPGVSRIPFSFGGLVLRGAAPSDSGIYLDGVEVPLAFHFGGFTSFYPSAMLAGVAIVPGNFDASYGRAEGGLVTLTTREPRGDRWRASGSVGLLDSGAMAEGPIAGGAVELGVRGSYFAQVAGPFVSADVPLPSYLDAQLRGSFGDASSGRWSPLVFLSFDRVANDPSANGGRGVAITQAFVRAAAPYLHTWGAVTLHVVPWVGFDRVGFSDDDNATRTPETFERPTYSSGVRADLARDYAWGHVRGGIDTQSGYVSHRAVGFTGAGDGPAQQDASASAAWADVAVWSELRVKLDGDRFAIKPGVRAERYGLTREVVVDPRVDVQEQLTDAVVLRAALGRYHQPPTAADVDPANGNPELRSSYFDQASLGVDAALSPHASASLTGFASYGHDLGVRVPNGRAGDDYEPDLGGLGPTFDLLLERQLGFSFYRIDVGRARAIGAEAMMKYARGRWTALVPYTLSWSERTDDPAMTTYLWRPFELDQRHDLNAVGSVELGSWRVGTRVQAVSGNPYSPTTIVGGVPVQQPWAGTLPAFFQLDLRVDRVWKRAWGDVDFYVDVQNATNRANVEARQFDMASMLDVDTDGLPIIPFVGVQLVTK